MKKNKETVVEMIEGIEKIIRRLKKTEKEKAETLEKVHPVFAKSAVNLAHYRTLRTLDIRELQKRLGNMGLSRLAKAESHLMANLQVNRAVLKGFIGKVPIKPGRSGLSVKKGENLLKSNAKALLGYRSKKRRTRIMVTLPEIAADDYNLVLRMIEKGMNCARINCAHDDEHSWKKMIDHVRKASRELKCNCKVAMDLGGPKIRTGQLREGPKVMKYCPAKDIRGRIIQPLPVWIGPEPFAEDAVPHVPAALDELTGLKAGDKLYFRDARHKKRFFEMTDRLENGFLACCFRTLFLETGMKLYRDPHFSGPAITVGRFPPVEQPLLLSIGDRLRLHKDPAPGEPAGYDEDGRLVAEAHISCTSPEIFDHVACGDPILFDDGRIRGVIRETGPEEMIVEIVYARNNQAKLRADKGINLPASELGFSGLTEKDKQDLRFVVRHADVVNFSFVNRPQDVRDLIGELELLDAKNKLGIILKIETQQGFNNLTDILLEAMQVHPIGVMIARGDLAIECGWENIGRIQEEIRSLCQAAHVPDIWATQVLENLAKLGIPSRAEITDAAMAQRSECVMLNKGPYILDAIELLDTILSDLNPYWEKNAPMLPAMEEATTHK